MKHPGLELAALVRHNDDCRSQAELAEDGRRAVEAAGATIVFEEAPPAERRHIDSRQEGEHRRERQAAAKARCEAIIAEGAGNWLARLTSDERKEVAIARGLFAYFPDALAFVARHSVRANEKHNPGQPVHWAREKSTDHEDCIGRHSIAVAVDPDSTDDGAPHIVCRAWRALAALQLWIEENVARGEKV